MIAGGIFAAMSALAGHADAFKTQYHEEITRAALPFVKAPILVQINRSNHASDTWPGPKAGKDKYHFNDCGFHAASYEIRTLHDDVLRALHAARDLQGRPEQAAEIANAATAFGTLLHAAQDFYAHSNWVESGARELIDDVFGPPDQDPATQPFPLLHAWDERSRYVLLGSLDSKDTR